MYVQGCGMQHGHAKAGSNLPAECGRQYRRGGYSPNPSDRYLEVRFAFGQTFQMLSLSGKLLLEGTTNTKTDITSLRNGLYLVQLPDGRLLKFVRE